MMEQKPSGPAKSTPKDANTMAAILRDAGISEYEPRVVNQMLEFAYKYVMNVVDDARVYSTHAKKRVVDVDDVRLAVQLQQDKAFSSPPPKELLVELARHKNSQALPLIKPNAGVRLPPDRYTLTAPNFRYKSTRKLAPTNQRITSAAVGKVGGISGPGVGGTGMKSNLGTTMMGAKPSQVTVVGATPRPQAQPSAPIIRLTPQSSGVSRLSVPTVHFSTDNRKRKADEPIG